MNKKILKGFLIKIGDGFLKQDNNKIYVLTVEKENATLFTKEAADYAISQLGVGEIVKWEE